MSEISTLFAEIEAILPDGGAWCDLKKAQTLAALVVGTSPRTVVEIGVWMGGSLIPMLLALRYNHRQYSSYAGYAVAIDPWSRDASIAGETEKNAAWWGGEIGDDGHEQARRTFVARLIQHDVQDLCEIVRKRSDDATPPTPIDLLHIDGNHTDQAVRDVLRFAPHIPSGGVLVMDDLAWEGDGVRRAYDTARELGFVDLYPLGTGIVMQRKRLGIGK